MKVIVRMHYIARPAFRLWRRGLSPVAEARRGLADVFYGAAIADLVRSMGMPMGAEQLGQWQPPIWVWESPTQGTFLIYTIRDEGWWWLRCSVRGPDGSQSFLFSRVVLVQKILHLLPGY